VPRPLSPEAKPMAGGGPEAKDSNNFTESGENYPPMGGEFSPLKKAAG